jgi:hypothetical protein
MQDTIPFIDISIPHLTAAALITAVLTIGTIQYLKKLLPHCGRIAGPIVCIIYGIVNTRLVPAHITAMIDVVAGAFALVQICHDTIIHALPQFVTRLMTGTLKETL